MADPLLACASLDLAKNDPSYRSLAMKYYGQGVKVLRENIALGKVEGTEDWVLLNVLHLNLFEAWNATSQTPSLLHIQGAAQMLMLRGTTHSRSESNELAHPDDKVSARIAVESVVYHTVNWSIFNGNPIPMPLNELWDFLEPAFATPPFPAASEAENSPVLGVPWQLYRFLSEATQLARLLPLDALGLESALALTDRLNAWESTAMLGDENTAELDPATAVFRYKQRARLSVIALKILMFKLVHPDAAVASQTIQDLLSQALQIIQLQVGERFHFWPLLMIGSAVLRGDQVRIIRSRLGEMSTTMRSGSFLKVKGTLEVIWDTVVPENTGRSCGNLTPTSPDGLDLLLGRDGRPGLMTH
ncbi:uncharacterized protein E0L32_002972 [Thyridium curvatum]|uniref:Uncharacterized protein n=1 Tax=Thyridium curvatum TaxID=1093900 RepID=A0A507BL36_9PEZI|nr:uncharacterized protein E0L32_002972 [Thyridium curvatum]TPX17871.1 hypothetical protein E0L32_002972 [Thyridium curvatum]